MVATAGNLHNNNKKQPHQRQPRQKKKKNKEKKQRKKNRFPSPKKASPSLSPLVIFTLIVSPSKNNEQHNLSPNHSMAHFFVLISIHYTLTMLCVVQLAADS